MPDDILFFSSYSSSSVAFYFSMLHVRAADVLSFFVQKKIKNCTNFQKHVEGFLLLLLVAFCTLPLPCCLLY